MKALMAKYIFDGENLLENKALVFTPPDELSALQNQLGCVIRTNNTSLNNLATKNKILPANYPFDAKTQIVDVATISPDNCKDLGNCVITPGFTDLQVNGIGGVDFNTDISSATLEQMYCANLKYGVTNFLPTLITSEVERIIQALEVIKDWFSRYANARGVIGIHLEGPFLSILKSGIHPKPLIIKPTDELLAKIIIYRQYFPIKMTIAPEVFTQKQLKHLVEHGIIIAIGHSNANYAVAKAAILAGVSGVTHVFNAMSGLTARNPGVIGAALNLPVYTGVIADLHHVDCVNLELLYKIKKDRMYLITDSVMPTGTAIKEFVFANSELRVIEGKVLNQDGTLGGAYLTMNQAIHNLVALGFKLQDVLTMAVTTPLKMMKLQLSALIGNKIWVKLNLDNYNCELIGNYNE